MKTALCDKLGIDLPIIQAPMGGAVGPALAASVSNAGGLGMLVLWRSDAETIRHPIHETRALTARPFGVNLNLNFPQEERLAVCLEERVPIISFFWREPGPLVARAKDAGAIVLHTVGTAAEARRAIDCGVDVVSRRAGRRAAMCGAQSRPCRSCRPWSTPCRRPPSWRPAASRMGAGSRRCLRSAR
jgi:NAD(P)H-dependent flavin oxidoreductase YrpB (nitropropane dioxygenase family)